MIIKNIFWLFILFGVQGLEAVTTSQVFAKYPNKYFVESGSCQGDGIQAALDAGFKYIYSTELAPHFYQHCVKRFAGYSTIHLMEGDSSQLLPHILSCIEAPATFWLDGHYSWGETARGKTNSPILQELECIRRHHIKTHTILIDDVRQFGTIEFDFIEIEEIFKKILEINPDYHFTYEDGYVKNDVLVAYIPKK